jgi:hypothetical protein
MYSFSIRQSAGSHNDTYVTMYLFSIRQFVHQCTHAKDFQGPQKFVWPQLYLEYDVKDIVGGGVMNQM